MSNGEPVLFAPPPPLKERLAAGGIGGIQDTVRALMEQQRQRGGPRAIFERLGGRGEDIRQSRFLYTLKDPTFRALSQMDTFRRHAVLEEFGFPKDALADFDDEIRLQARAQQGQQFDPLRHGPLGLAAGVGELGQQLLEVGLGGAKELVT